MDVDPTTVSTGSAARSRHCHPEPVRIPQGRLRRGIWLRTERTSQLWPDLSTSLRFAQGDKKQRRRARDDKRGRGRAFALIELLVVISIIVLLMALLFPVLRRARNNARSTVCRSKLHQWGLAFKMYTDGNEGRWFTAGEEDDGRTGPQNWLGLVVPFFYNTPDFAACPMATTYWDGRSECGPFDAWWPRERGAIAYTPAGQMVYTIVSYGFNYFLSVAKAKDPRATSDPRDYHWGHCDVRGAANVPVLCDSTNERAHMNWDSPPPARGVFPDNHLCPACIDRHDGGINMLFMDWSVRKVGLKELWTLKWHRQFNTAGPWTKAGAVEPEDWPQWMRRFKDY